MTDIDRRSVRMTVTLSADLAREARRLAVDQGVSLSAFLSRLLAEQIAAAHNYHAARERQVRLLEKGLPLGTHGKPGWRRDDLYVRRPGLPDTKSIPMWLIAHTKLRAGTGLATVMFYI